MIDDSGDRKDGTATAHVGRQWLGRLGKTDNGVVSVTTAPSSADPSATPSAPGANTHARTGNCPHTSAREQKKHRRHGRCGPATTRRPPG
ncbi:hypothetical protein GCM10009664_22560 [Kitasatospora gansuensis]